MRSLQGSAAALTLALLLGCGGSSEPGSAAGTDPALALLAAVLLESLLGFRSSK